MIYISLSIWAALGLSLSLLTDRRRDGKMATDYARMIENLPAFYDFNGKTMIAIGGVKAAWDPENFFRTNRKIQPAPSVNRV